MAATKARARAQAIQLYVEGFSPAEIAGGLGVAESTVQRWRRMDGQCGIDWDARRADRRAHDPIRVIRLLEEQIADLAADPTLKPQEKADGLAKLDTVVGRMRERWANWQTSYFAVAEWMLWAARHLDGDDPARDTLQRLFDDWSTEVKEAHGG